MSALQLWLQNHNRKMTQDAIDEALMEYISHVEKQLESAYKTVDANWVSHQQLVKLTSERDALKQQRDELLAAAEAIEIDAEECLDFDEFTAILVSIDAYHKLMEAIASVKGGAA